MADLSDVTAYLATAAANAAYPNGTSQPSVAAMDVRIFEGWPIPDQLDRDMLGQMLSGSPPMPVTRPAGTVANVSVFAMQGTGIAVYQQLDDTYVITPAAISLIVVSVVNGVISISGSPATGEYLTIIADHTYAYSASGASAAAILATLATSFSANYSGVSSTGSTLTIPGTFAIVVRQGGVGTLGKVTHRQRHPVMVTVWSPTQAARATLAAAIDNVLKQKIKVVMPDTSQALVIYSRTNVSDEMQSSAIYRRDLIYDVEYATVFQFPGYVVTTVNTTTSGGAIATSLT